MPNRQLTEYVQTQLAQKMDLGQLRSVLLGEGWSQEDIEAAIKEAYASKSRSAHKAHHINFVAVAVLAVLVLILGVSLFLIVFANNNEPNTPVNPQPPGLPPPNQVTGWVTCSHISSGEEKQACYKELNEEKIIDCMAIDDSIEQQFCFRAQEDVLLSRYKPA